MATLRQKALADEIIKNIKRPANKRKNKSQLLESVGYSESVATTYPTKIIEQKGVQNELKAQGFSSENAKRVIAEIMDKEYAEDKDRLKAAELTLKVTGDFAAEKSFNLTATATADDLKTLIQSDLLRFRPQGK